MMVAPRTPAARVRKPSQQPTLIAGEVVRLSSPEGNLTNDFVASIGPSRSVAQTETTANIPNRKQRIEPNRFALISRFYSNIQQL
jgi:hypothetical protein